MLDGSLIKPNNEDTPFFPLVQVKTNTATPGDDIIANVRKNCLRDLPRLNTLPGFMKPKSPNDSIALVGGGPSLKKYIHKLKEFKNIVVCGSPNDYVMSQGVVPTWVLACDPDPIMAEYLKNTHEDTTYLIASGCDKAVFDAVARRKTVLWHCHSDQYSNEMMAAETKQEYFGVGGGCTVGLRGLSIACMFGYQNIHFFGFDSCMGEDDPNEHHAYKFATDKEFIGDIYTIKAGNLFDGVDSKTKQFYVAGYQLAQADQFKGFYAQYGKTFRPTFYGGGLLETVANIVEEESHRIAAIQHIIGPAQLQNFTLAA